MFHYTLNPESSVPIYRQLVDQINARIRSGAMKNGTQLPTVREMAQKLHLSPGTVKKAYDCLQEMGDIEMTRRRGTFVKFVHRDKDSRKHQAMVAIDQMIRKMTELQFSPAEIQIFLNLKMREWGLKWTGLRVTVVTECPEIAPAVKKQLEGMPNVQCTVYPLRQLQEYPYSVDEQSDVILIPSEDESRIAHLLPDGEKLLRVAFAPDAGTLVNLSACAGKRIGVPGENVHLAQLMKKYIPGQDTNVALLGRERPVPGDMDVLVVPEGEICDSELPVIPFVYQLDKGSLLYLEERVGKMRHERQMWPAATGL